MQPVSRERSAISHEPKECLASRVKQV